MSRHRPSFLLLAPAALALAACGNGSSQPTSASQWLRAASKAASTARSAHFSGYVSHGSERVSFNLHSFSDGALDGHLEIGRVGTEIIELKNGSTFLKAPADFWAVLTSSAHLPTAASKLLAGHWIKFPSTFAGQLTKGLTLSSFSSSLGRNVKARVIGRKEVGGEKTVAVEGPRHMVVYIATSSPHYPLLASSPAQANTVGRIRLSGWGSGSEPKRPSGAVSVRHLLSGAA